MFVGQMDVLADEDHTPPFDPTRILPLQGVFGGFVQTRQVPILCTVEHRPDFKQALSTLQQLKQKEEGAQRNKQWAQRSSSSWWSWQGSWWTPYSYESHHGDEPSTDRIG